VHTFFEEAIFVAALAIRGSRARPALLASRRDLGLGAEEPWYHALFPLIRRRIERGCAGIVVNAEAIRRRLVDVDRIPDGLIRVIPNGVTVPPPTSPPPELLARAPAGSVWAMIAASLRPVKRLDTAIRAVGIVHARAPELPVQLAILGEGEERPRLEALARTLGVADRVHLVGRMPRATDWLQHGHMGLLSSQREGLSNAILEYLSCGLPVAATAVGGNGEMVDDACGILVPAGDAAALADAIIPWIRDEALRREKGRAALERVRNRYSWERTMALLEDFYVDVDARGSARSA
jgi:glycosyltransferase involved in cell wall biosynthesis